jgi:SAM-dependent MidA family methyltransferase
MRQRQLSPAERVVRLRLAERGRLTFAEFMQLALHEPSVGYYARRPGPLGREGDFYTSAELHPGFAALIGRQVMEVWWALRAPARFVMHEAGPGSGLFARDLLDWLRSIEPDLYAGLEYRLEEVSPQLRERQQRTLAQAGHLERASWVDGPAEDGSVNLLFANELLDALPVHLVEQRDGRLWERYVVLADGGLAFEVGELSTPRLAQYFERLGRWPGEGCRAEVNLAAVDWLRTAGRSIGRGLLLVVDYGYLAEVLYARWRREGTLLCYYRHTLNSDPLERIGEQDLTSHVDFSSAEWAGETGGLTTLGLVSQRRLLRNLGWDGLRRAVEWQVGGQAEREANLRGLDGLVDPDGLGRLLALVQQRGLDNFAPLGLIGGPEVVRRELPLRRPDHLYLPSLAEAEGLPDFEAQWQELFGATEEQ